jgi:hypothetical protein
LTRPTLIRRPAPTMGGGEEQPCADGRFVRQQAGRFVSGRR